MSRFDPHSFADDAQGVTRHIDLNLDVDFETHTIACEARLHLREPFGGPLDLDSRDLQLTSVKTADGADIPYEIAEKDAVLGDRLRLNLPDGTTELVFRYRTADDAVALGWLDPVQTAGGEHPFLFSQCQPIHARTFVPCQDTPRFRVTYAARVTVPAPLRAVMSAASVGEEKNGDRTTWLFDMPQAIPTYLLALAVGNLDKADLGPRSCVYAEPETLEKAAWEFDGVDDMLLAAEKLFGTYEWDRFDLLVMPPAFPYGGMENPRLTFLTPTLISGDRSLVNVVAHELAHSWTGNLVTNATMNDFWLNEGFTVWAERRILEALYGEEYAALHAAIGRNGLDRAVTDFGDDSPYTHLETDLEGTDPDEVYSLVPYEKGFLLVALLERTVGRERFADFIRAYIEHFRFQSITTAEFIEFADAQLPGVLDEVGGRQWIAGPGVPDNAPSFPSERLDAVRTLAAGWPDGKRPPAGAMQDWSPEEWQLYLADLPRSMSDEECRELDETFGLTNSGNNEILVGWLTIASGSGYEPALPRVREVLSTVGRMKYLKPLYKALLANDETRNFASEIFDTVAPSYHALSRGAVEGMFAADA